MRLVVTCERRFKRTPDGRLWSTSTDDYSFWARYRAAFEEIGVLARVEEAERDPGRWRPVEGEGVRILPLPNYIGVTEYLLRLRRLRRVIAPAVTAADAVVLRVPSHVATTAVPFVRRARIPYAVEVVGNPYEAFAPGAIDHPLRPLLRWRACRDLRVLCREAAAAAYVTERTLQRRFPPGPSTYATHYSSLELTPEALAPAGRRPPPPGAPITVASVGSMELSYKGLGDLVTAASRCVREGLDLRLLFIGGGRSQGAVAEVVRSLGLETRVTFTGELPGSEAVLRALSEVDLFVLASKTEGLPRVVIEAMSQGLPVLASRVGGTPELLSPECLFEPGDVPGLAARLKALAESPATMAALAEKNLARARDFLASELRPRREALYRHLRACAEARAGGRDQCAKDE